MKKVFYIAVAVLVLARLIDFVFYGGHAYDLVATVGFAVLFAGALLEERARAMNPPPVRLRRRANVIAACGIALVLGSFRLSGRSSVDRAAASAGVMPGSTGAALGRGCAAWDNAAPAARRARNADRLQQALQRALPVHRPQRTAAADAGRVRPAAARVCRRSPDHDSEGLLLLTDNGTLAHKLTDPRHKADKTYWVQVEGTPSDEQLQRLRDGVELNDGPTLPAKIERLDPAPSLWTRDPPVRFRKTVPDSWLAITIREGRNRRAADDRGGEPADAAAGPRVDGTLPPDDLQPGQWRQIG